MLGYTLRFNSCEKHEMNEMKMAQKGSDLNAASRAVTVIVTLVIK